MGSDLSGSRRDDGARRRQRARVHRGRARRDRLGQDGLGPRMLLAGIVDGDGPSTIGVARVADAGRSAARWVDRYHDAGFDQIKIYSSVTLDVLRAITAEAHGSG